MSLDITSPHEGQQYNNTSKMWLKKFFPRTLEITF